jgi:hypothetical protein
MHPACLQKAARYWSCLQLLTFLTDIRNEPTPVVQSQCIWYVLNSGCWMCTRRCLVQSKRTCHDMTWHSLSYGVYFSCGSYWLVECSYWNWSTACKHLLYVIYALPPSALTIFVDQLITNWYIIRNEYTEVTIMDWSDEDMLCFIDHYIIGGTW